MTPTKYLASGSESAEQTALFMWATMAGRFGFVAADDDRSYEVAGHAMAHYGPGRERGCGTVFTDTFGPDAVPELLDMFAIPNGGLRDKITASNLKREGVKPGVPDILLPVARGGFHGLFIEMKRRTTGRGKDRKQKGSTSGVQDDWIARLRLRGYGAASVVGFEAAKQLIRDYLAQPA